MPVNYETQENEDERLIILVPPKMKHDLRMVTWQNKESMGSFVRAAIQEKLDRNQD